MNRTDISTLHPTKNTLSQLNVRYKKAIQRCFDSLSTLPKKADRPTNPLLIAPSDNYYKSAYRVMYFGQETNDWEGYFRDNGCFKGLLEVYNDFVAHDGGYNYGGHFWNAVKSFQESFNSQGDDFAFLWNNVIKIGKKGKKGCPCDEVIEWQKHWFGIIRDELNTFRPDVVIFFSGPHYDWAIEEIFPDVEFNAVGRYTENQFARVTSDLLPKSSFRTYHPGYLYRFGFDKIRDIIVKSAKRNLHKARNC